MDMNFTLSGPWIEFLMIFGIANIAVGLIGTALVLVAETWLGWLGSGIQHAPEYAVELVHDEGTALRQILGMSLNLIVRYTTIVMNSV